MAGISIHDTFQPGYADNHPEEVIYGDEEFKRRRAWMNKQRER
jgi:hypothetical protein